MTFQQNATEMSDNTCSSCYSKLGAPSSQYHHWITNCDHTLCACCLSHLLGILSKNTCPIPSCGMFVSSLEHTYYKIRTSRHPAERKETISFLAAKNQTYSTLTTETDHHCIDLVASSPSASDESVLECIFEMLHSFIVPVVLYSVYVVGRVRSRA